MATAGAAVEVTVNGRLVTVAAGARLADYLAARGIDPRRVAVERNREVVARAAVASVVMEAGDVFEIVHFVGGG